MDFCTIDRKERTVYVTGIHPGCDESQIYDLFSKTGVVEKVVLHLTEEGNPHYCLVVYKDPESVMFTIAQLNGHRLMGQAMNLRPLRESSHAAVLQRAITRRRNPYSPMSPGPPPPTPTPPCGYGACASPAGGYGGGSGFNASPFSNFRENFGGNYYGAAGAYPGTPTTPTFPPVPPGSNPFDSPTGRSRFGGSGGYGGWGTGQWPGSPGSFGGSGSYGGSGNFGGSGSFGGSGNYGH